MRAGKAFNLLIYSMVAADVALALFLKDCGSFLFFFIQFLHQQSYSCEINQSK